MQFTGELFDPETGLYNLRARQYDPATGHALLTTTLTVGDSNSDDLAGGTAVCLKCVAARRAEERAFGEAAEPLAGVVVHTCSPTDLAA